MRRGFDKQLENLHTELIAMGALCESAIANAAKALTSGDPSHAEKAKALEREIDEKEQEIESLCLKLLLQQQPVARDLRQISSALKMITDMERIGDQAADIAEISEYLGNSDEVYSLDDMARETISMVTGSIDSYVRQDLELAKKVMDQDDVVDDHFLKAKEALIARIAADPSQGGEALDLLMTAKYFERIGDHAVNIAEWVVFAITGDHMA